MIQNPKDVVITENIHDTLSMAEVVYMLPTVKFTGVIANPS